MEIPKWNLTQKRLYRAFGADMSRPRDKRVPFTQQELDELDTALHGHPLRPSAQQEGTQITAAETLAADADENDAVDTEDDRDLLDTASFDALNTTEGEIEIDSLVNTAPSQEAFENSPHEEINPEVKPNAQNTLRTRDILYFSSMVAGLLPGKSILTIRDIDYIEKLQIHASSLLAEDKGRAALLTPEQQNALNNLLSVDLNKALDKVLDEQDKAEAEAALNKSKLLEIRATHRRSDSPIVAEAIRIEDPQAFADTVDDIRFDLLEEAHIALLQRYASVLFASDITVRNLNRNQRDTIDALFQRSHPVNPNSPIRRVLRTRPHDPTFAKGMFT